jgi:dTDP-4-amino-4,6-dideoxygalactose transaminase
MSEINAILGIHQLNRLDSFIIERNRIAKIYFDSIKNFDSIELIKVPSNIRHSYWKYPIILKHKTAIELEKSFHEKYDISLGTIYYPPIHLQPIYKKIGGYVEGTLLVSEDILKRETCLPMFVGLTEEMIQYIIESLSKELN